MISKGAKTVEGRIVNCKIYKVFIRNLVLAAGVYTAFRILPYATSRHPMEFRKRPDDCTLWLSWKIVTEELKNACSHLLDAIRAHCWRRVVQSAFGCPD